MEKALIAMSGGVDSSVAAFLAMEQGLTFAIREGGHTVGSGRVVSVIE